MAAQNSYCYQITIPDSTDRLGKTLTYTPYDGTPIQVYLEDMGAILSSQGVGEITYYICSRTNPYFAEFGNLISPEFYGITVSGGTSLCISDADCMPIDGGGGNFDPAYCYQIAINTTTTDFNIVQFDYTPYGGSSPILVQARNWAQVSTSGSTKTLYLCSATVPTIYIGGDPIWDPQNYGVLVTGGTTSCITDDDCWVQTPINCTLSNWGYGATQQSWTEGAWSPCTSVNGSYQQYQTRYVITPASNGGTCVGETIRYQSCTPQQSGTVATITTPTFSGITANSATATITVTNNGGSEVTSVTFRIFKSGNLVNSIVLSDFRFGISTQFTSLLENTEYTVQAFATNSTGTAQSQIGTFTTSASGGITTPTVSNLTQAGATLTSTFTNSSGDQFPRYGLIYKIGNSTGLTVGGQGVVKIESGSLNPETNPAQLISTITGLAANTQYYAKSYVQGADGNTYVYSSAVNFTTSAVEQGANLAQLSISSIALPESTGTNSDYDFITSPTANLNRSYVSVIEPSGDDPIPGVYQISATLQQADLNSLVWTLQTKISPSDVIWQTLSQVTRTTDINTIVPPPMWTYYTYSEDRTQVKFRPRVPGYYRFELNGAFSNGEQFTVYKEVIIGRPTDDIDLSYSTLRQGISSNIQVTASPTYPEWIPEFSEDALYGITVSQTGSNIIPALNINNSTRSFSALWGISSSNESISPTLTVNYSSPFKNQSKLNNFTKNFVLNILAPFPVITFSNPSLFSSPVNSGSNVTINVSTQYATTYSITSSLGTSQPDSPITYNNVQVGTYTITATATNGSMPDAQTTTVTATLTVEPASPILAQLPQQKVGRNLYIDINTLPYVNLNGSSFSNLQIQSQPTQGTVTISNYQIRYIPNQDYTGTDLFSFRVKGAGNAYSNIVNVSILVSSPNFNVGTANEPIVFNSTEVGSSRDIIVPITNNSTTSKLEISSISLDQEFDDFKLVSGTGQNEIEVLTISNINIEPTQTYSVKIRVQPNGIGVRTARLKIDHN